MRRLVKSSFGGISKTLATAHSALLDYRVKSNLLFLSHYNREREGGECYGQNTRITTKKFCWTKRGGSQLIFRQKPGSHSIHVLFCHLWAFFSQSFFLKKLFFSASSGHEGARRDRSSGQEKTIEGENDQPHARHLVWPEDLLFSVWIPSAAVIFPPFLKPFFFPKNLMYCHCTCCALRSMWPRLSTLIITNKVINESFRLFQIEKRLV